MAGMLEVISENELNSKNYWCDNTYLLALTQSIKDVEAEMRKAEPNLDRFLQIFYELMQSRIDSPLECIWAYSALKYRGSYSLRDSLLDRYAIAKKSFNLVSECSVACDRRKTVALLAPIVYQLFGIVKELIVGVDVVSKSSRKLCNDVKSFIGKVLGFASLCCCIDSETNVDDSNLVVPLLNLVGLWFCKEEEPSLKLFLPLVSAEMCDEIFKQDFDLDRFSGIVVVELFLLKLLVDVRLGNQVPQMEKELRSWVVASINGFQNIHLFDVLLRMLLEPKLFVTSLSSAEDEHLLRLILYDAVVMVDYSFLSRQIPASIATSVLLKRLIIICESAEFYRKRGDHKKVISYTASFSSSKFYHQVIKEVSSRFGMDDQTNDLKDASPKTILKWLLGLEDHGVKIFYDGDIKLLAIKHVKSGPETSFSLPGKNTADSDIFYIDNTGGAEQGNEINDDEMADPINATFVAAAHAMHSVNRHTKRKSHVNDTKNKRSKLIQTDSLWDEDVISSPEKGSSSSSESEVQDPTTDEE